MDDAADTPVLLLLCPSCGEHFRGAGSLTAPYFIASCGHNVCLACVEAVLLGEGTTCPVCSSNLMPSTLNIALASYSEEVGNGEHEQATAPTSQAAAAAVSCALHPGRPLDFFCCTDVALVCSECISTERHAGHTARSLNDPDLAEVVQNLLVEFVSTDAAKINRHLERRAACIKDMKVAGQAMLDTTCAEFCAEIEALKTVLDGHRDVFLAKARKLAGQHDKDMDTELDSLEISAQQVTTYAAMARNALSKDIYERAVALEAVAFRGSCAATSHSDHLSASTFLNVDSTATRHEIVRMTTLQDPMRLITKLHVTAGAGKLCTVSLYGTVINTVRPVFAYPIVAARYLCVLHSSMTESFSPTARENAVAGIGVLSSVICLLDMHPTSKKVQKHGCGVLAKLSAFVHGDIGVRLFAEGAIPRVYAALDTFPASIGVVISGISTLCNMATSWSCSKEISSSGGVSRVLDTMQTHINSARLQETACAFLSNMNSFPAGTELVCSAGPSRIREAMLAHPNCEALQTDACRALGRMAESAAGKLTVVAADGIALVCRAMEAHPYAKNLQILCCRVLRLITVGNSRTKNLICAAAARFPDEFTKTGRL